MNFFLKAKHWQLFILMIGIPIVFQIMITLVMFETRDFRFLFTTAPLLMIIEVAIVFGWSYTVGTNLHRLLPADQPMNLKRFKIFLVIPFIYMILLSIGLVYFLSTFDINAKPNIFKIAAIVGTFLPIHLFCMFCIIYSFWFNGKAIKTIEMKKELKFEDYAGEFFLFWFFIIGVWILQPKINKLFDESLKENETLDGNMI